MTYTYLYEPPDHDGMLTAENPAEAVLEMIDIDKNGVDNIPETLTLAAYRHEPISTAYRERLASSLLEMAIEDLNERYGHLDMPDPADERMREAASVFADTVAALFPATAMNQLVTFEVVVPRKEIVSEHIDYSKGLYKRRFGVEFDQPLDRKTFDYRGADGTRHTTELKQQITPHQRQDADAMRTRIESAQRTLERLRDQSDGSA